MGKVDEFKKFVKDNPRLISYVRKGDMTWQKFYELYDLYGEDKSIWDDYLSDEVDKLKSVGTGSGFRFEDIIRMAKNIDVNKVQDGLTSLQKTLSLFGDLIVNKDNNSKSSVYNPRPLYRKFEDQICVMIFGIGQIMILI